MSAAVPNTADTVVERSDNLDWQRVADDLNARGNAVVERLFTPAECVELAAMYDEPERFRNRIVMARHGFGRGEYRYFDYPLPARIAALRTALYRHLAPIANRWNEQMRIDMRHGVSRLRSGLRHTLGVIFHDAL